MATDEKDGFKLLAYKIDQVIEQQEKLCDEFKDVVRSYGERISVIENRLSWGKGLLAGIGLVSVATLIKLFFNIP